MRAILPFALAVAMLASPASAAVNLVPNGDFELGDTGFSSDYSAAVANTAEGQYAVLTNPFPWNPNFLSVPDHTGGGGQMMFVGNGSPTAGQVVWQSTPIAIAGATDYFFEAFVMNVCCNPNYTGGNSDPLLTFSVSLDGGLPQDLATLGIPAGQAGVWHGLSSSFNSGSANSAVLSLVNANTVAAGNDFAVDDIFLGTESIVNAVPEPSTWAMMLLGFGLLGGALRRRGRRIAALA